MLRYAEVFSPYILAQVLVELKTTQLDPINLYPLSRNRFRALYDGVSALRDFSSVQIAIAFETHSYKVIDLNVKFI